MRMKAFVVGLGMTRFGKHLDRSLKSLAGEAIDEAVKDAGIDKSVIQVAYSGNAVAGLITGQEMIRGQVVLQANGLDGIPVVNIENACATASTAFHQASAMVTAGLYDIALVCAFEKLYDEDKMKSLSAYGAGVDIEYLREMAAKAREATEKAGEGGGRDRSVFMDFYAATAIAYMEQYGTTVEHFAGVSAKNSFNGSLNPKAQFQEALTVEDVLNSPMVAPPLTRPMCSPIGDGAAAAIVMSEAKVDALGLRDRAVEVVASTLRSGKVHTPSEPSCVDLAVAEVYEEAGIGPDDLDIVELHDASAPAEIMAYSTLKLCAPGDGGKLISDGVTALGGRLPVNTSGGLLRKGHPIGVTGLAQIVELSMQLRGEAGARQVAGARVGFAHNNGGTIGTDVAAACMTILKRKQPPRRAKGGASPRRMTAVLSSATPPYSRTFLHD